MLNDFESYCKAVKEEIQTHQLTKKQADRILMAYIRKTPIETIVEELKWK